MDPELLEEFLLECDESRESLDTALLELEGDASRGDLVAAAFRAVHSIKGAAGFMEAKVLEKVAHTAENILSGIRDGRIAPRTEHFSALFRATDALGALLEALRDGDESDMAEHADLIATLTRLGDPSEEHGTPQPDAAPSPPSPQVPPPATAAKPAVPPPPATRPAVPPPPAAKPAVPPPPAVEPEVPAPPAEANAPAAPKPASAKPKKGVKKDKAKKPGRTDSESNVRVDVKLLDDIMNLVGELVVCRNQILRFPQEEMSAELTSSIHRLDHLTSHIQERVMKTRMRPVGGAWSRLPRMVRDLASSCEKECELLMDGQEVELDRSILAQIKDPLAHMIRNAVDHGLEGPAERVAAGKPARGRVRLSADHVGGQVHIELKDDGRGLNTARILEKAVSRGLVPEDRAEHLAPEEVHQLIFEPGFSTAQEVSRLSGRGVGMDVVRSNLTQIGGAVDVQSREGEGTTIRLKIPLTLAILPALIVHCRGLAFAIPQTHLIELVDLECNNNQHHVEELAGAPVLRRRGELLPLVYLDQVLGLADGKPAHEFVVVVQADDATVGVCVDAVEETEEIVVKPLGPELEGIDAFSGATVRGDGSIALILDVLHLARSSRNGRVHVEEENETPTGDRTAMLRFELDGIGIGAVEVASVIRIEDVIEGLIERHAGRHYMAWHGKVLPIVDLVGIRDDDPKQPLSIIVCRGEQAPIAVAVSEVLDVVDTAVDVTPGIGSDWSAGMAIVEGISTAILDLQRLQVR